MSKNVYLAKHIFIILLSLRFATARDVRFFLITKQLFE